MATRPTIRPDAHPVRLEIDGRRVVVPEGITVLHAAELAGRSVPSLCAHKELSPFGGCRLCAVEIEGRRGYPLACSTEVADGMAVTTESEPLGELRREILELILSQHPSSCLVCDERDDCRRSQNTIRKAGVSTGCRSCPNDGVCELQRVVEQVGVTEIEYPVTYRGLEPEHDDPFFDRDYNLCVLCGRCVRMCHEVRGASVLAFTYRGRRALIGPAFGRSHAEAGCEFCGACVTVCPTGALADKVSKWDRKPESVEVSTCPFCGVGCQLEIATSGGALSWARGAADPEINDGQLCLRGRFCLPETTHHPQRVRKPMLRHDQWFRVANWDEALAEVAGVLAATPPDELLMLVSSDLTNESLYAAQRLVWLGLGGEGVDSTARTALPGGPARWSRLFSLPVSFKELAGADAVLVAGVDTRFAFSVVGVQVRRALRRGARLVTVDARETNMARMAHRWLRPGAGDEATELAAVARAVRGVDDGGGGHARGRRETLAAARDLAGAERLAVVLGPRVFDCAGADGLADELELLAGRSGVTVVPLTFGTNVRGALELGVLSGAGVPARPRVIYLVGDTPYASRPDCDYLIAQDLYLPPFEVDAFLPAASFAEAGGTVISLEGRVQEIVAVEQGGADPALGAPLPDWRIFSELAARLGRADLQYADAAAVRAAIRAEVAGMPAEHDRSPRRMVAMPAADPIADGVGAARVAAGGDAAAKAAAATAGGRRGGRYLLVPERAAFRHRGFDLGSVVEGLGELRLEEGLRLHPDDLAALGVEPGGPLTVSLEGRDVVYAARPDPECPRGAAYVTHRPGDGLPVSPTRVRIRAGEHVRTARTRGARTGHPAPAVRNKRRGD